MTVIFTLICPAKPSPCGLALEENWQRLRCKVEEIAFIVTRSDKTGQVGFTFSYQFLFDIWRDLSQLA